MANHETKSITIYQKTYQLPVLEGDSFNALQSQIKQRQEVIKDKKYTRKAFFGLYKTTETLTFDRKFEELESLVEDYNKLIVFLTEHKTIYLQFFVQLTQDLQVIVKQKFEEAFQQEKERLQLIQEEKYPELVSILKSQKQQILSNVWLFGKAFLLMSKKLKLISDGIEKITSDQDYQRKSLTKMVAKLGRYRKVYALQQKINKSGKEAGEMAEAAVNLEQYLQPFIGSFQGLIEQLSKQDNTLNITVTEVQSLVEDIMASQVGSFMSERDDDLSKNMLDFLVTNEQKKERLIVAVEEAKTQSIEWGWQQIDIDDCQDLTKTITELQSHIDGELSSYQLKESDNSTSRLSGEFSSNTIKHQGQQLKEFTSNNNILDSGYANQQNSTNQVVNNSQNDSNSYYLESHKNINYEKLEKLLSAGKWKEADQETSARMLQVMDKNTWRNVYSEDLLNFPVTDLRIMDQLWLSYSNGKFGFSVQKQIWIDCGGTPAEYGEDVASKFGVRVGWIKDGRWLSYRDYSFNIFAPIGHLPGIGVGAGVSVWWVLSFLSSSP